MLSRSQSTDVLMTPRASSRGDRFIPNRSVMNAEVSRYNLLSENSSDSFGSDSPSKSYKACVASSLFGEDSGKVEDHKILALKNKAPAPRDGYQNHLKVLYSQNVGKAKAPKKTRHIASSAEKVLDAPGLLDDYYLNLIDWSSDNILSVALGGSVYLWNATSSNITELLSFDDIDVTSVAFSPSAPQYMAVGTEDCQVQLWDVESGTMIRTMQGHQGRVGSLAWNGHIVSSGSFDSEVHNHDVRMQDHLVSSMRQHEGEVCGLKWSLDGTTLASGGNDNQLNIWSLDRAQQPLFTLNEHVAAVKALAWCPWQPNLLASGGGTADRTIKFWNTSTGTLLNSIDTESQVCSLQWSKHQKEIVSSHGFSKNQLCVWKYPSMVKMAELTGHSARVLHMAMSPDGTTVLSASADESLRFWRVFEPRTRAAATKKGQAVGVGSGGTSSAGSAGVRKAGKATASSSKKHGSLKHAGSASASRALGSSLNMIR